MEFHHLLLVMFFLKCADTKNAVPVFMLDEGHTMSHLHIPPNPLVKMTQKFFDTIVKDAVKKAECVIIFIENTFSTEDLSGKDKLGPAFYNLHQDLLHQRVTFIPSVAHPFETLMENFEPQQNNVFYISLGREIKLPSSLKYMYVLFPDITNMTRIQTLRIHDMIIRQVYFYMKQSKVGPVVAFYTGKVNPIKAEKMQLIVAPSRRPELQSKAFPINAKYARFRLGGMYMVTKEGSVRTVKEAPKPSMTDWFSKKSRTTMQFKHFQLRFVFISEPNHWILEKVQVLSKGEEIGGNTVDLKMPWTSSYICSEPMIIENSDGSIFTISHYQLQPRRDSKDEGFGDAISCTPFLSVQILAGILVVFILMLAAGLGIGVLFNCGVNDKFDDPESTFNMVMQH